MATNRIDLVETPNIIVVNAIEDEADANAFKDFIKRHASKLKVRTLYKSIEDTIFTKLENVLDAGGYVFFYLTKNFCENVLCNYMTKEVIETYVRQGITDRFIPILTQSQKEKKYAIPLGLRTVRPIRLYRITRGESISKLTFELMEGNDTLEYEYIVRLFNKLEDAILAGASGEGSNNDGLV